MTAIAQQIGFVGIGMMGFPMASLLYHAGYSLSAYDVDPQQTDRFCAEHAAGNKAAHKATSLYELGDVNVVITMLPDSDIVDGVVLGQSNQGQPGLISILPKGSTIIDMSSSQPLRSKRLSEQLAEAGIHFLDAPVSGGVKRAIDGTLSIMVGGDAAVLQSHQSLLATMGKTITHVGGPGAGHAMKALNNYVSAAGLVAMSEALLVGQEFGLDPNAMVDVLNNSTGKNNSTENKAKQFILSGTFDANFGLQLMTKDLGIAMQLGDSLGLETELGHELLELWQKAANALEPDADHTEIYRYLDAPQQKHD